VHAVAFGAPLGLTDEQLAATVNGSAEDPVWSEHDSQLLAAADELFDTATISEELWQKLAARLRDDQLLELVIVTGWYRMLSCIINAAGIEPESWAARFP